MRYLTNPGPVPLVCIVGLSALLASCGDKKKDEEAVEMKPLEGKALASPRGDSSGPLFTRLAPQETGIDLVNPIIHDHPKKYLYASAMGCGGVAVGDIDKDGLPDLFFTGGPVPNRLYRQVSALKFEDITSKAGVDGGGAWSTGASLVDIDNDGDLDIYVCNYDSKNLLYINKGDGTFTEQAKKFRLDFHGAGHTPAFGDYDFDGNLDLYLMTNFFYDPNGKTTEQIVTTGADGRPIVLPKFQKYYGITGVNQGPNGALTVNHDTVGQADILAKNNGDRTFTATRLPAGKGNTALWWDSDGDGRPGIFVANDFKDPDRMYHLDPATGSLEDVVQQTVPHVTWFSMGADSADLDRDGFTDMMVADMSGTNHFKQKIGMGAMSDSAEFLATAFPRQYMRNAVFLGTGTARLREAAHLTGLANSDWTWTVRLSDFDNDGWVDVYLTNGMAVNLNVADNEEATKILPGETEWDKHVRAKTGPLKEQNLAFRNRGDLKFEDVSKSWGLDHVGMSYSGVAADLDRDGDLEIIVANLDEPISIYRNNSTGNHRLTVELQGRKSNRQGLGATVRIKSKSGEQVRFLTLARGYMASGEALLHFGLGSDPEVESLTVLWPSGHEQEFKNIKADQHLTITEPKGKGKMLAPRNTPRLFVELTEGLTKIAHKERIFDDFNLQPLLPKKMSQLGPGMAWGDIDGDNDDDLFLSGPSGSAGKLLRNDGKAKPGNLSAVFTPRPGPWNTREAALSEDMGALFFDADGDDDLDLYVVSGGVEAPPGHPSLQDRLYLNDGKGNFSNAPPGTLPKETNSGGTVTAADFDRDGDLDLFVGGRVVPGAYPTTPQSSLLRNDGGKFVEVIDEVAPDLAKAGMVTSALWTDADGDKAVDLMVTYEWGPVRFFRNQNGKLEDRTSESGIGEVLGWWNGISGGDIDGDGDIDYAVTNVGLNSKYKGDPEHPVHLFYGNFDESGKPRCVEAKYEGDTLYPVRGRSCSSHAMPFLLDKFKSYTEFAMAELPEIYPEPTLDAALKFSANELRTGVLINDGTGKFTFRSLPRIAQIAPGFGVDLRDMNGDGHLDLYLVQNFYGPEPETGHMAGGLSQMLLGDSSGAFRPVSPERSGLIVPGDAKSLATPDLNNDGWPDVVVGVNNDKLEAFQTLRPAEGRVYNVRLEGAKGNPTALGARVTLHLADGSRKTAEIYAAEGYLSQSPAQLTFGVGTGKVQTIEIHWPDGSSASVDAPSEGNFVIIEQTN